MNKPNRRVLVVGTGYHSQLFGPASTPLTNWSRLLERAAEHCGIKALSTRERDGPMEWERLVTALVELRGRTGQAHVAESELRKAVQAVLSNELRETEQKKGGDRRAISTLWRGIEDRITQGGLHLVSLNFDCTHPGHGSLIYGGPKLRRSGARHGLRQSDVENLYRRRRLVSKAGAVSSIWHPHGIISCRNSLRLGFRDYGLAPASYAFAFSSFKAWQRSILGIARNKTEGITQEEYSVLLQHLEQMDRSTNPRIKKADHWIARFMLLPVDIVGVGLSREEFSLRWLLVQRRRNSLRMANPPPIRLHRTVQGEDLGEMAEIVRHPSHDEAWNIALRE